MKTIVINLARRPDRKENIENLFQGMNYEFFEAIDGKTLEPNDYLYKLFLGNDFQWRKGVIGCALSHYTLWQKLQKDESNDAYLIYEDDINYHKSFDSVKKCENFVLENQCDFLFLGYHMFKKIRPLYKDIYDTDQDIIFEKYNSNLYIGGFFSYIITKSGANKMIQYIEKNGIKHGIDYLIKIGDELKIYECRPHIVRSDWVDVLTSRVDSDIQKDFDVLNVNDKFTSIGKADLNVNSLSLHQSSGDDLSFSSSDRSLQKYTKIVYKGQKYRFYQGLDSHGNDINFVGKLKVNDLLEMTNTNENISGFNTLGFLKSNIQFPLIPSVYYTDITDGLYVVDDSDPVFIQLVGGLCNQLFQISTAYAFSKKYGLPLQISRNTQGIPARATYWDSILTNFKKYVTDKPINKKIWREPFFHYQEIPNNKKHLIGYFQSSKYFKEYKDEIISLLNLQSSASQSSNKCAMHIRRGDYVNSKNFHGILDEIYYKNAMVEMKNKLAKIQNVIFDIFSDDLNWCKEQDWLSDCNFINEPNEVASLSLMSKYTNFILSNSSFSWWSAYLANGQNVIVPDEWFGSKGPQDYYDIYEDHWIRIPIKITRNVSEKQSELGSGADTNNEWIFHKGLDSDGCDINYVGQKPIADLLKLANTTENCVAVNTLGFLKSKVNTPLYSSPYFNGNDGIYVKNNSKKYIRVKFMCNWASSKQLCDEWNKMTKGNYTWNDIQMTWEDNNIDFWVIVNKPSCNSYYDPKRTIVFQLEPWCFDPKQNWGVKTWGNWAIPRGFLHVYSPRTNLNPVYWLCGNSYTQLSQDNGNILRSSVIKQDILSHIASHRYVDAGHKYRIDFLHYLEKKNDIPIKIFGHENYHKFKNYAGTVPNEEKEIGISPYKYYFMCENNSEINYATEKLWEPILNESLCFYWGCPNISEYIDSDAYVYLDITNFEQSYLTIKQAIAENLWEKRLPAIKRAKHRLIDYYNVFPTLERVLTQHQLMNTRLDKYNEYKRENITGIAKLCDWFICKKQLIKLNDTDTPQTIFLSGFGGDIGFEYFFNHIIPILNKPFILILASEDATFPTGSGELRFNHYGRFSQEISILLNNPLLIHMFVENLDTQLPKLSAIPLGILNYNITTYENILKDPIDFSDREYKTFVCHRNRPGEQWKNRETVTNLCRTSWKSFTTFQESLSLSEFKKSLQKYTFTVCVNGGGLDPSPRVWEALICGSIPIVKHSVLDSIYQRFPIAFVDDWTEDAISLEKLDLWFRQLADSYENPKKRKEVINMLYMDYWWKKITEKL